MPDILEAVGAVLGPSASTVFIWITNSHFVGRYECLCLMVIAKLVTPATVKYDGLRDFTPISLVGTSPLVLVGKPELAARNAGELLQLLRNQPGKLNYATSGIGTSLHLAGELINQVARVNMVHVPYKVGAQIVTDLTGNQIDLAVLPLVSTQRPRVRVASRCSA